MEMKSKIISLLVLGSIFIGGVQAHAETIDNSSKSKAVSTASGYKYNKHYWHTNNQNKPSTGNDALLNEGNTSNNTDAAISDKFMAQVEQAIFNKVNEERAKAGVAPLTYNTTMEKYARIKSQDMGDNNYFSHTDLNGNNITAKMKADGVTEPRNLEEQAQVLIGKDIYEKLIKGYTEKQWGRKCTDLPAFIIKRLPVRLIFDNNYFNDKYQGIPVGGYNKLIDGLLEGVETKINVDFFDNRSYWEGIADKIVFTGKIDEFYNYQFGKLNYRTVRFETEIIDKPNYQGNAVVNYTEREIPYTRVIEHKHFEMFGQEVYETPKTVISKEFSTEWKDGMEPYYPVNDEVNSSLYAKYKALADKETNVIFGGRLAEYKYYDMAPIIEKVLSMKNI